MGVYEELGVRPVINASGTLTRLGGSRMAPEVLAAMCEAAASFVHIDELQEQAGRVIAEITGAEAGYVVSGAAAGLALGIAACVAGLGVRLVEVGYLGYPGAGGTYAWQIEEAITERTAAVACPILDTPGTVPLPEVCEIAHAKGVPVIVDAAAELPPRANLRRFIAEGADLVTFSGGKAIGGPQASGILAGRRDLIASVALQHQDMDVRPETWSKRWMIAAGQIKGVPHQGFGRSMKVGREEIVGLITALRRFAAGSDEADLARWNSLLDSVEPFLTGLAGVSVSRFTSPKRPIPLLHLDIDARVAGLSAYEVANRLLSGEPAIAVGQSHAETGRLTVNPHGLTAEEAEIAGRRLRDVLTGN